MLRPESLDHPEFGDFIRQKLDVIEAKYHHRTLRMTLTPEEVGLIYPPGSIPPELRDELSQKETEHHLISSPDPDIYAAIRSFKGKYGKSGIRGELSSIATSNGIHIERWGNFLHAGDDEKEVVNICSHFGGVEGACQSCIACKNCQNSQSMMGTHLTKTDHPDQLDITLPGQFI